MNAYVVGKFPDTDNNFSENSRKHSTISHTLIRMVLAFIDEGIAQTKTIPITQEWMKKQ